MGGQQIVDVLAAEVAAAHVPVNVVYRMALHGMYCSPGDLAVYNFCARVCVLQWQGKV